MKVEYKVGEGDVQVFAFVPDQVTQSQAELVEKRFGASWDDFLQAVRGGNAKARKVLLWHLLRATHHTLRYEDVPDFRMGDVKVSFDYDELMEIRDRVLKAGLSEEDREAVLTALDIDITEALDAPEGSGKAGDSSTSAPVSGSGPIA